MNSVINIWKSLARLFRFVTWYAITVTAVIYLMPIAAVLLEERYDAMSGAVKIFSMIGFFVVVTGWHIMGRSKHIRASIKNQLPGSAPQV